MKRNFVVIAAAIVGAQLLVNTAYATHPVTFIGPSVRLGYADMLTDTTAFALMGEGGGRNYRGSATAGWMIQDDLRIKFTGEYLGQKLYYSFTPGTTLQWNSQGAIGGRLEYDYFSYEHNPTVSLTGYYSGTPGKTLTPIYGQLSESNAYGIAPGISLEPWEGARAGVDVYYDTVHYEPTGSFPNGPGLAAKLNQAIADDFDFNVSASVRQPFNDYAANLNWTMDNDIGEWVFGFGASYTIGKHGLPSAYNAMATVNFLADWHAKPKSYKGDYMPPREMKFKQWTSVPAVYMPEVLSIARN